MPKVTLSSDRQSPKDIDKALRQLKKIMEREGILKKLYEKEQYEKPSVARVRNEAAAKMRQRRLTAQNRLPGKRNGS